MSTIHSCPFEQVIGTEEQLVRVFTEQDFKRVRFEDYYLTLTDIARYKRSRLGKPVPVQTVPDDKLIALGYEGPEPWILSCLEEPLANWK